MGKTLEQAEHAYIDARREAEIAEAFVKKLKKEMRDRERELIEVMIDTDTKTHKLDAAGLTLTARNNLNVSVTLGNTDRWLDWVEQRGKQREDYTRETIIGKNLRELAREVYKDEGLLAFDDLPVDDTPAISVIGWDAYMQRNGPSDG